MLLLDLDMVILYTPSPPFSPPHAFLHPGIFYSKAQVCQREAKSLPEQAILPPSLWKLPVLFPWEIKKKLGSDQGPQPLYGLDIIRMAW